MKRDSTGKRRVEEVTHGPFRAVIRMDDLGVFSCEYGALSVSGALPKVREWARTTLRKLAQLEWHPVMEVTLDDRDCPVNNLETVSNINCQMERYWIAWSGQRWVQCPWVVDPRGVSMVIGPANSDREQEEMPPDELSERRIACSRDFFHGPKSNVITWPMVRDGHNEKIYYVPYTEETWATMLGILERLRELRGRINKLLSTNDGWRVLAKVAQTKLLSASK